jgi:hypothetical protein
VVFETTTRGVGMVGVVIDALIVPLPGVNV